MKIVLRWLAESGNSGAARAQQRSTGDEKGRGETEIAFFMGLKGGRRTNGEWPDDEMEKGRTNERCGRKFIEREGDGERERWAGRGGKAVMSS